MNFKIAHDARPQAKALLAAAALSLALWFIPYAWVLTYPFQLFVTFMAGMRWQRCSQVTPCVA
jgi:hypothetical protein